MRRLVVAAATGLTIVLVAFSLHTLSTAMEGNETQALASVFESPIDPPSTIIGTVFNDANGNGEQDSAESGIAGVTVELANSYTDTTTTDFSGVYSFTVALTDHYTVTSTTPTGYAATTIENRVVHIAGPGQAMEGIDFGYRGIGSIAGTVFSDDNGNEVQDGTEQGIRNATVTLLRDSSTISTTMTSSDGSYSFAPLFLGDYSVRETDLAGYDSTTPNEVDVSLTDAGQEETVDFGDRGFGAIQGTVFNDEDGDGEQDLGETGINGVTVKLLSASLVISETTTASDGSYTFDPTWLDDYTVQEIDPEGYTSTTPNQVAVPLTTPQQLEVVDFGDRAVGTIQGTVFSDDNDNEVQDGTEQGIADVTVALLQNSSTISTTTTASDGSYSFGPLFLGDYTVRETDLEGYASTTPNEVNVSLTSAGQETTVDFGDRGVGTIRGTVFDDMNGDGTMDAGEPGIEGVTVGLVQDSSTISTTTTANDGTYSFAPLFLGEYAVQETDPEGYDSTTPNEVDVFLTEAGQEKIVDFGDRINFIYLPLIARNYP